VLSGTSTENHSKTWGEAPGRARTLQGLSPLPTSFDFVVTLLHPFAINLYHLNWYYTFICFNVTVYILKVRTPFDFIAQKDEEDAKMAFIGKLVDTKQEIVSLC
jgi:hypothetical protein